MADVYKPPPKIDMWLRQAEKYARRYDKPLVLSICIIGVLLTAFILLEIFSSRLSVEWVGQEWTPTAPSVEVPLVSRREARVAHRVGEVLKSACDSTPEETVFAAQVTVDGAALNWKMARVCPMYTTIINPTLLATGEEDVMCRDDHNGEMRTKIRASPITVSSAHTGVATFVNDRDVCAWMYVIDMLESTW